ncbi:MAG: putative response-associated peptidase YedK [Actinomycetota bacterium]
MCGRFVTNFSMTELVGALQAQDVPVADLHFGHDTHNFNAAPTQLFPVVVPSGSTVTIETARWGLVPRWMKDDKGAARMINARIETVREKPSFRGLLSRQRCIIPMNGYYEWNRDDPRKKVPHFIQDARAILSFAAGLWTTSQVTGDIPTFTMLTEQAPPEVAHVHDRAPVLVDGDSLRDWLFESDAPVEAVAGRERFALMATRVSTRVNSVRNNDESLLHEDTDLFGS